jgi:hypothetical protein
MGKAGYSEKAMANK